MRNIFQKKAYVLTALSICLLLGSGIYSFLQSSNYFSEKANVSGKSKDLWELAFKAYSDKEYEQASQLIENSWQFLIEMDEGCELTISIFAENKQMDLLELASRACIERKKAIETAGEALAFSLSSQGKIDEALSALEELEQEWQFSRLKMTLAQLNFMLGRDEKAGSYYLSAVENGELWALWVSNVLKIDALANNKNFIEKLLVIVATKAEISPSLSQKLIEHAKNLGLDSSAEIFARNASPASVDIESLPAS